MKLHLTLFLCMVMMAGCKEEENLVKDNFWEVVSPASQNMNENVVDATGQVVSVLPNVKSFLIIRNAKIVHEQYQNGATKDSLLNIQSITKRVTATLLGIAIDKSYIDKVTAPVSRYFPEMSYLATDPGWKKVNIYHLVNMISGMNWVEVMDLPAFQNTFSNPLPMIFSRNIAYEPGTVFSYNSPGTHLISYIIERSSDMSISDFSKANLFYPLQIKKFKWQEDGNHIKNGAANLCLTARDLAKIGQLYLQNGKWFNKPVVSNQWVDASLRNPINLDTLQGSYLSNGPDMIAKPGEWVGNTWRTMYFMGKRVTYGDGYGGQVLLLVPDYQLIVVMLRREDVPLEDNISAFQEFFAQVLPMVLNSVNK